MSGLVDVLPYLVAAWLLLIGLYGVATSRHLIHAVLSLSVAHSAVWVLLIAVGFEAGATAPILDDEVTRVTADPVAQALAVTDVVVSAAVTALLLAFVVQIDKRFQTLDPAEIRLMRG